jgi:DNA-directed RNA polymerase subunit E'/Rpb7
MAQTVRNVEKPKIFGVYTQSMLTLKVSLSIKEVGKNMKQNLEKKISKMTEGKCIMQGFIRPGSVKIVSYSSGVVNNENVEFQTAFECMICYPMEGMLIECQTKSITKAGIHAEVVDTDGTVPLIVFVSRDHHYKEKEFSNVKENMKVTIRVIGVRFELNDPYISVIGKLIDSTDNQQTFQNKPKPRINIYDE